MLIGVPLETLPGETRVAVTPETAKKLKAQGQRSACSPAPASAASVTDAAYQAAGAEITDAAGAFGCDSCSRCAAPTTRDGADEARRRPHRHAQPLRCRRPAAPRRRRAHSFALEAAPRTTRAQSMDVLSSQANIAGYKAVMIAADKYQRFFPMLMTAAGTVKAARVVILGVGVAGLQAIATAKRLGAVIEASDVRPERQGAGRIAGRQVHRGGLRHRRREGSGRRRGRLCQADARELAGAPEVEVAKRVALADIVDQHRADPRPRRADARHRGHGQVDEAGLGDRRHRRRQGPDGWAATAR